MQAEAQNANPFAALTLRQTNLFGVKTVCIFSSPIALAPIEQSRRQRDLGHRTTITNTSAINKGGGQKAVKSFVFG